VWLGIIHLFFGEKDEPGQGQTKKKKVVLPTITSMCTYNVAGRKVQ
jgi:hypothetical protein